MRKLVFVLMMVMPMITFAQTTPGFVIDGKLSAVPDNTLVILTGFSGTDTIAKTKVIKGSFQLKGKLPYADVHMMIFPSIQKRIVLFMGDDHVAVAGDSSNFADVKITGAPTNYDYEEFVYHIKPLNDFVDFYRKQVQSATSKGYRDSAIIMLNTAYNIYEQTVEQFVERKNTSPVAALVLAFSYDTDPNKDVMLLERRFKLLHGDALKSQFATNINEVISIDKVGAVGTKALDFTQNDTTGKPVSLSQFKGKYVLVDFWASWCRPCRAENPNVVAAYNQYKDKNFTILSVSLDQTKDNWLYAIKADGLTWNHVSDLQYWSNAVAKQYHIEQIPSNFLVDPNGTIIAKNLRGDELAEKLSEYLK